MLPKLQAHYIQAFTNYKSAAGTQAGTALVAGIQFENGLYVGGTFSAAGLPLTTDNITISGTAGNGYIQYAAQTVAPSLALVHVYSDSGGHFAIGASGSTANDISFTNSLMTANRSYAFQDKTGTLAMVGDNVSEFTNDSGFVVGPGSAVSGRLPSFNGTTGKLIQDSGILVSSVVLTSRTLTEGAGLAGNTYDLSANRTLAMGTPSTLSIASTNAASGTTHTHLITSSSNPGAAASLLASDASGFLTLPRFTATGYMFVNNATANLYLKDTSTGFQAATTLIITPQSGNTFQTTGFTTGVSGWNQSNNGDAEFNNVRIRGELTASVFKVSEISATAGTLGVFYSASTLAADFAAVVAVGDFVTIRAKNSDAGAMLFAVNDILRIKSWTGSAISDTWFAVTTRTNNGTTTDYGCQIKSGTVGVIYKAGTAIVDYGQSGTGFITLSTDGTVGSSPNLTMATHAGSPWSTTTTLLRLGNLNGSYGYATDVYGLGIGQYGTASKSWQTIDQTNGFRIGNNTTVLGQWDVSGNATFGQVATSKANVYWNSSNNRLEFRGSTSGTVVQSYIDTDGSFTAGGGDVILNANGLQITAADPNSIANSRIIRWMYGSSQTAYIYNTSLGTSSTLQIGTNGVGTNDSGSTTLAAENSNKSYNASFRAAVTPGLAKSWAEIHGDDTHFKGLTIAIDANVTFPTHMLDVYGTGWFQSDVTLEGKLLFTGGTTKYIDMGVINAAAEMRFRGGFAVDASGGSGFKMLDVTASGNKDDLGIFGNQAVSLWVGQTNRMTVRAGVNIGGTTDPGAGNLSLTGGLNSGNGYMTGYHSTFKVATNEQFHWRGHLTLASGVAGIAANDADSALVPIEWRASAFSFTVGNVRFHNYGAGTLQTDASGNITASSDEKLKTHIRKFRKGLDAIKRIEPILYRWNKKSGLDQKNDYVGFGARHTKRHIPEAVGKGKDGFHTMSDRAILATAVNAIKELEEIVCH